MKRPIICVISMFMALLVTGVFSIELFFEL